MITLSTSMRADDPTLPDHINLGTLGRQGLVPILKKEQMDFLREMLGEELSPEPVFVNLTTGQLELASVLAAEFWD